MRPLSKITVLLIACLFAMLIPAPVASAARRDPVADARRRVEAAKRDANAAAARYNRTRGAYERLGDEVVRLTRDLETTEARIADLRAAAAERAVAAYKGRSLGVLDAFSDEDAMDAARRSSFLAKVNANDAALLGELRVTASDLRERKDTLAERRAEQKSVLQALGREQRALQAKLDVAARAQRVLEEQINAQRRSRRGGGISNDTIVNPGGGAFVCPIRGPVAFSNDWGNPRSGGRRHQGTDLMSPRGTPNVAVVSGSTTARSGGLGGTSLWLRGDNGTTYYYAHLDEIRAPAGRVSQGQVIGTTGNTGNARGGPYHTHFEIHPGGGGAINPYPTIKAYC